MLQIENDYFITTYSHTPKVLLNKR